MLNAPDLSERRDDDPRPAEPGRLRAPQRRARRNAPQPAWLQPVWLPYVILGGAHPLGLFGECRGAIGALPGELGLAPAEMPVGRGLLIDRPHEVQHLAQPVGC